MHGSWKTFLVAAGVPFSALPPSCLARMSLLSLPLLVNSRALQNRKWFELLVFIFPITEVIENQFTLSALEDKPSLEWSCVC